MTVPLNTLERAVFDFMFDVCYQIPLLDEGIRIHGEKSTEQLKPLHNRLVSCFQDLRAKVEKLYGVITLVRSHDVLKHCEDARDISVKKTIYSVRKKYNLCCVFCCLRVIYNTE